MDVRFPEVFDSNGSKLIISNYDSWALSESRNRYHYNQLVELSQFWRQGFIANPVNTNFEAFIESIVLKTREEIFTSDLARLYADQFWIECTPESKVAEKIIDPIIKKKSELINKLGFKTVSNYLNRIRKVLTEQNDVAKLDRFMKMFNISDTMIEYPETCDIDSKLVTRIQKDINQDKIHSSISNQVRKTCMICESRIS